MRHLKTCPNGHRYHKISDCPVCEAKRAPSTGFTSLLSAPARRALEHAGIDSLAKLASYSEKDILALHGMGKASMPLLRKALAEAGLAFKS